MADISHTIFSNVFAHVKLNLINFYLMLYEQQIGFGSYHGLAQNKRQAIAWTNDNPVPWVPYPTPALPFTNMD